MEHNDRCCQEVDGDSCGSSTAASPEMDRNPSPPPEEDEAEAGEEADAIGETVYSKHWLFSTLTRLIQMVTDQESGPSHCSMELTVDLEEDVCKVCDMAMDKDVAVFLQEFKAPDILLGVIAKSRSPRLTEICVGILGNMACFHDTSFSARTLTWVLCYFCFSETMTHLRSWKLAGFC